MLAGACLLGLPGADPLAGEARMSASASDSTALLLDRLTRLPDLTAMARDRGAQDIYAELDRLKREHDAAKKPYRFSMPYRNPPRPCSSGAHSVPSVKHMLVNPARKETVELWEAQLHEAKVHGAALPAAIATFLANLAEPGQGRDAGKKREGLNREALVDRAMRAHGDFGVYGDVRAGLAAISMDNGVTLADVEGGIRVDIVPNDGHGHELQFLVTHDGMIEDLIAGESIPAVPPVPEKLSFRFNAVQLVKDGKEMSLTVYPVWGDAQRDPPEGFEDGIRVYRLNEDDFYYFYRNITLLDFAWYARLTDADFATTPPDLRHTESLYYSVNGRELVSWGHSYAWLKDAALRQPLLDVERQLQQWSTENPSTELPAFRRLVLRDVQGLEGGRNVYVDADGSVTVQIVTPAETGLHERLYEVSLALGQLRTLLKLLEKHPLARVRIPARPGIPDQARPEITLIGSGGKTTTVTKWDDDRQPDFDAIYAYLLELEQAVHTRKPVREGVYDPAWRPA